jgi:hypothetical protein
MLSHFTSSWDALNGLLLTFPNPDLNSFLVSLTMAIVAAANPQLFLWQSDDTALNSDEN